MDPYARRAQQAAAAVPPPPAVPTPLDELEASLGPADRARTEVALESLASLESRTPDWKHQTVDELKRDLEQRKSKLKELRLKDGGQKLELSHARMERYIRLREEQERQRGQQQEEQQQQQRQQQQQQHGTTSDWLQRARANQEEAEAEMEATAGRRQVVPAAAGPLGRNRNFGGLSYGHDGEGMAHSVPLVASRGAPTRPTPRQAKLLTVTSKQSKQQQAPRPQQQQQQRVQEPPLPFGQCEYCHVHDRPLKAVRCTRTGDEIQLCFSCINRNPDLQPIPNRPRRQSTIEDGLAAQQQRAAPSRPAASKQQQGRMGPLNLQPVPPAAFHSQLPAARNASVWAGAGGGGGSAAGGSRKPKRGKGAEDEEYVPGREAAQTLHADEDDSDYDWNSKGGRKRHRQQGRRSGSRVRGGQQDAEPVCIDLLSDEDGAEHQHGGAAGRAAAGAAAEEGPARRARPARAAAPRSSADRFKGLTCLYPPGGGAGAVEVTALDLPRLDPDEFLNDTVIDFYIRWLQDRLPQEVQQRCYFFNTFFFKKLTEEQGGVLPPEVEEWAKQEGIKGPKLQALRNHQKVKKWTKDVDLFEKDYIFVPVHEALHWSLMVVCHPGVVSPPDTVQIRPGDKTACILHLDSLSGSHRSLTMANRLRLYLQFEWHIKSLPTAPDGGVPKRWAEAHPGQTRCWMPTSFPYKAPKVPTQDNHCDCGLFVCSYIEYFTHRLPKAICWPDIDTLKGYAKTNRDLFDGTPDCVPGLLTQKWFPSGNPSHLRYQIRTLILELMAERCGLWDRATGGWKDGDEMAEEVKRELLELEHKAAQYILPDSGAAAAVVEKQERQEALERRQLEQAAREEDRKAQRPQRQEGAAKGPAAPGSRADREIQAAAAEARLRRLRQNVPERAPERDAGMARHLFDGILDVAAQRDSTEEEESFEQLPDKPRQRLQQRPRQQFSPGPQQQQKLDDWADEDEGGQGGSMPDFDPGFAVDLSDGNAEEPEEPQGAAAAAAGSQDDCRRSASPELCPVPQPSPASASGLPGMSGSALPSRGAGQLKSLSRRKRRQVLDDEQDDDSTQPAVPAYGAAQQQQQQQLQQQARFLAGSPSLGGGADASSKEDEDSELDIVGDDGAAAKPWPQLEQPVAEHPSRAHANDARQDDSWEEAGPGSGSKRARVAAAAAQPLPPPPQQQPGDTGQGNGRATAAQSGRRKRSGAGAAGSEAAAAPAAVASPSSPQHQHQHQHQHQQEAVADEDGGGEDEVLDIDGSSIPAEQPASQQPAAAAAAAAPHVQQDGEAGQDAAAAVPASSPVAGPVGPPVHASASGCGLVAQQMEHLHLQPSDASRPPAQAAAARLQQQLEQQRMQQAAAAGAAAAEEVHDLTIEDAPPRQEPPPAAPAAVLAPQPQQELQAEQACGGRGAAAAAVGSGGSGERTLAAKAQGQQQAQQQVQQQAKRKRKSAGPLRISEAAQTVGGDQPQTWNPHLLVGGSQEAGAGPIQGPAPQAVPMRQIVWGQTPAPEKGTGSTALKLFHHPHGPQAPGSAVAGGHLGQLGQPQEFHQRYSVAAQRQQQQRAQGAQGSSPRMAPASGDPRLAAAAAVEAEAAVYAALPAAERKLQQQQQLASKAGGGHATSPLHPDQVSQMLQHVNAYNRSLPHHHQAPASIDGAQVKHLTSAFVKQAQRLKQHRRAAKHGRPVRPRSAPAAPPQHQQLDAAVDLTGLDDD